LRSVIFDISHASDARHVRRANASGTASAVHQPWESTSDELVFGTGSCIGCHGASSYDFSLIITKAERRDGAR